MWEFYNLPFLCRTLCILQLEHITYLQQSGISEILSYVPGT
jgi:hypothetical protein